MRFRIAFPLALCILTSSLVSAQVIDFESIPGQGTPIDNQLVHDQFVQDFGVKFRLYEQDGYPADSTLGPRIALVGGGKTAFLGVLRDPDCDAIGSTRNDTPADLVRSGCWLLTDDGVHPGDRPFDLRIIYSEPVFQAGGELIDVDNGPEGWRITALDSAGLTIPHPGNPIEIIYPSTPGTGDGSAVIFEFDPGAPIYAIELKYIGEDSFGRGLAFDNFYTSSLPTSVSESPEEKSIPWGELKSHFRDPAR